MKSLHDLANDYRDMVYNTHVALKDYWSYEQLGYMPIRDLTDQLDFFMPKLKEIANRQANNRVQAELTGKTNQVQPGMRGR